jgi:hypothetical protein
LRKTDVAKRKLVDWLGPCKEDGELRAMVGTTYEFQQEFFETDFLPNLLDLGAWKERNWTSRIALERRLADLKVAAVFIDSSCYRGRPDWKRSSKSATSRSWRARGCAGFGLAIEFLADLASAVVEA